jgi:hypothetical protein
MVCKWVRFAYRFLPLPAWRAFLLDRHINNCLSCQSAALGDAAIRSLGVTPAGLEGEPPLSPFAAEHKPSQVRTRRFGWRYAFGFTLVALLGVIVAVYRPAPPAAPMQGTVIVTAGEDDSCVFAVLEAKIGGEPARPIVFKPGQPGMTIVWFEKIKKLN